MQAPQPPSQQASGPPQQQQHVMPDAVQGEPVMQHNQPAAVPQHHVQGGNNYSQPLPLQHAATGPPQVHHPQQQQQQHPPPPAQQPQQPPDFPHQGLNGGWQSDKDLSERRQMIHKIVHLLQERKPNAPQDWLRKLPQMAKRLEVSLYRSAKSFAEYNDASTLKQRLQQFAHNIAMKPKEIQEAQRSHFLALLSGRDGENFADDDEIHDVKFLRRINRNFRWFTTLVLMKYLQVKLSHLVPQAQTIIQDVVGDEGGRSEDYEDKNDTEQGEETLATKQRLVSVLTNLETLLGNYSWKRVKVFFAGFLEQRQQQRQRKFGATKQRRSLLSIVERSDNCDRQGEWLLDRMVRQQRETFLVFIRILLYHLKEEESGLHKYQRARKIIHDCIDRNRLYESGLECPVVAMKAPLQSLVEREMWRKAERDHCDFLEIFGPGK